MSTFRPDRIAVHPWQREEMKTRDLRGYEGLNEAQRDKMLLEEAKRFMIAHPVVTMQLAAFKEMRFVLSRGRAPAAMTVFAVLVCSVLAFRQRLLIVPLALVMAYVAPFAVIVPYFYRYRYPIEPVIAVLAGTAVAYVARGALERAGWGRCGKAGTAPRQLVDDGPPIEQGGALADPRLSTGPSN